MKLPRPLQDIAAAFQFLTRLPLPRIPHDAQTLPRAATWFPLVGLAVGTGAAFLFTALRTHLSPAIAAFFAVLFTVAATGALHEDGLADVADAFGGGTSREKVLLILKDSRIGAYGALALLFSVLGRTLLIAALPITHAAAYLITAHLLSRWTILPIGRYLPSASPGSGQGARLARQISTPSLCIASAFTLAVAAFSLHWAAVAPLLVTLAITAASAAYYQKRIGGVTGDCFGATVQLTELAVYCMGAWHR